MLPQTTRSYGLATPTQSLLIWKHPPPETLLSDIDSLTALKDVDIDDHEARGPTTPAAADLDDGACMALLPECETETLLQNQGLFDVVDGPHFVLEEFLPR